MRRCVASCFLLFTNLKNKFIVDSFADLDGKMVPSRMDGRFLLGYSHGKALVRQRDIWLVGLD